MKDIKAILLLLFIMIIIVVPSCSKHTENNGNVDIVQKDEDVIGKWALQRFYYYNDNPLIAVNLKFNANKKLTYEYKQANNPDYWFYYEGSFSPTTSTEGTIKMKGSGAAVLSGTQCCYKITGNTMEIYAQRSGNTVMVLIKN